MLNPSEAEFQSFIARFGQEVTGDESLPELRKKLVSAVLAYGESVLMDEANLPEVMRIMSKHFVDAPETTPEVARATLKNLLSGRVVPEDGSAPTLADDPYSYFGFIPPLRFQVIPGAATQKYSSSCWDYTATGSMNTNGSVSLTITASNQKVLFCSDHWMLGTAETIMLGVKIEAEGVHQYLWDSQGNRTTAETYDLSKKGVRFFQFTNSTLETVTQIVDTALLFLPELINPVDPASAARNQYFMQVYAGRTMNKRATPVVTIPESSIQSGDFLGIIRFDGLDPMLAWAMGSTTGHTAITVRDPVSGQLFVHESTVKDDYWPTNGIQKTPYQQWIQQAINASYNVVHAPLSATAAAQFNATAALQWFTTVQGFDYGYYNMLWGWVDTVTDNYPCVAPDFSSKCLEWAHVEVLFSVINKYIPAIGDKLFTQAWNLRLGTSGLVPADLYMLAEQRGIQAADIPTLVEQDTWVYQTTRNGVAASGPSMVCCVFVCEMWKHAGMFSGINNDLNCAELTNWDDYVLTILDPTPTRPQQCVNADPDNVLCQLVGDYTLSLNDYSTKAMYPHMAEKCPSEAPQYLKPANC